MPRCSGIRATHQVTGETVELWAHAPQKRRGGRNRILNVPPDVFDLRDRQYLPQIKPLPDETPVPKSAAARLVRDQLDEGACTGFAMAAVVNHLMAGRRIRFDASPRFLYENARRYDEWKGEEYEGSSIRGAMKGFLKHGVCPWSAMPYRPGEAYTRIPAKALAAAGERPLGAYFRVSTSSINDLQSAIEEAGVVLVSAQVHRGWNAPRPPAARRGTKAAGAKAPARIVWRPSYEPEGGHAFVFVGYTRDGFILQNSWGTHWGSGGFALLGYEDWLVHRMDAWVCQLGVGSVLRDTGVTATGRLSTGTVVKVDDEDIRGHYLAIRNGVFDDAAPFRSGTEDLADIAARVARHAKANGTAQKPASVMFFAHGGLVDENGAAARTLEGMKRFLPHGVYPIHFIWHTGLWETAVDLLLGQQRKVGPAPGEERVQGWLKDKLIEAKDETLELALRLPGRPVWEEMKGDALESVHGPGASLDGVVAGGGGRGPAFALMDAIRAACASAGVRIRWHLVGHSAGSIFHCHLFDWFVRRGLKVDSCSFVAPAVTCALFRRTIMANAAGLRRFALHTMPDRDERDDHCMKIYSKSLLYLVSESFERDGHEPLLGLARNVDRDWQGRTNDVDAAVSAWLKSNATLEFHRPVLRDPTLHGSFDEDPRALQAVLQRM